MENLAIVSDTVRTQVSGLIRGARIIREIPGNDGTYQVIMSIDMYGPNSVAAIAFNAIRPSEIHSFPEPSFIPQPPISQPSISQPQFSQPIAGNYTGVVIVAQNMGLKSTFSPVIKDEAGITIYGNKFIDPDFAIIHGMVDYSSLNAAMSGNTRAGTNPLVVNALRVVDHNCNVVVSNADAQRILAAHAQNGFLTRCAVVFARQ